MPLFVERSEISFVENVSLVVTVGDGSSTSGIALSVSENLWPFISGNYISDIHSCIFKRDGFNG